METENNARYIKNKFPDKPADQTSLDDLKVQAIRILQKDFEHFVSVIKAESVRAKASVMKYNYDGTDVFQGAGSYLALYVRLLSLYNRVKELEAKGDQKVHPAISKLLSSPDFNEQALLLKAEVSLEKLSQLQLIEDEHAKKVQISFYMGGPSVYLNGCLLSLIKKDAQGFETNFKSLLSYKKIIMEKPGVYYKEILYGVSGYIYCLLALQTHLGENAESSIRIKLENDIIDLVELVINYGIEDYGEDVDLHHLPKDFRLVYQFHNKEYFGAAHGLFGVLYILMRSYQLNNVAFTKENQKLGEKLLITVRASLRYLLHFQMKSGNFPSSAKSSSGGSLVQFCHGSPGAIACLVTAAELFKNEEIGEKSMHAALLAGENVWNFGILKKGYGLCHGITGNGYSFLTLYRFTSDSKWLYRALCFISTKEDRYYADEIAKYDTGDRYTVGQADFPYSMMLGLAGDICMEVDTLLPTIARFPGYEV